MNKFDAIIVLGGGRFNDGSLTPLSTVRLDKGMELYRDGISDHLLAMGGEYSTYRPGAIRFNDTGAVLRKNYYMDHGVPENAIISIDWECRDTIGEAFALRKKAKELGLRNFALVTSEKHMERALFLFQRILGKDFTVYGDENTAANTGDLLDSAEEKEYLALWKEAFSTLSEDIPDPENWSEWYKGMETYYLRHKEIHDRFHPAGKESQAYSGVKEIR